VIDMPVYLGYLRDRFARAGGRLSLAPVTSLADAGGAPVVVNCSGAAARDLVPDPAVVPIRGQVAVARNPGIEEFYIDHSLAPPDVVYMFPHGDTVVLGGTVAEGDWNTEPRPETAMRIVRDCAAVDPRLRGAPVVEHRVGLRPFRPEVRLEPEPLGGGRVLWHNYGHGGAGVTLSWGCAREVTAGILCDGP
jgi:D-amino-acid oxidase